VIGDLAKRGARRIEAYPNRFENAGADDLWNGPEAMFRAQGFSMLVDHAERLVLSLDL